MCICEFCNCCGAIVVIRLVCTEKRLAPMCNVHQYKYKILKKYCEPLCVGNDPTPARSRPQVPSSVHFRHTMASLHLIYI